MTEPAEAVAVAEERPLVTKTWVYRASNASTGAFLHLLCRMRVEDLSNLPSEGGVLLVANHQSFLDIPLVAASTRRHVSFVARESLARSAFLAFVMRGCGAILVRPGKPDRRALREMVAHLRLGDCVAVFPEGTRSPDGTLGRFRPGASFAARQAGVPIVPVGIRGTCEALPKGARLPRPRRVALRFGAPIDSADPGALEAAREAVAAMVGDGHLRALRPDAGA